MTLPQPKQIYRHYKGDYYTVIAIGQLVSNQEKTVVYQSLYGDSIIWIRPLVEFTSEVEYNGEAIKRFTLVTIERK